MGRMPTPSRPTHICLDRGATSSLASLTPLTSLSTPAETEAALAGRTPEELRTVSARIAAEAADHVRAERSGWGPRVGVAATKSSGVDPVTAIDRSSEALIRRRITGSGGAQDAILGEEQGGDLDDGRVTWVVDPVDGTVNLIYGIPASAVSVAATVGGVPVAGAVADIARRRVISACVGGEVTVEWTGQDPRPERTLDVLDGSSPGGLDGALVATGFSYQADRRRRQAELLVDLLPGIRDIRRVGSAALDLCAVAAGAVDAYYEHGLGPWDHAAGCLIAARAGADVRMPSLGAGYDDGLGVLAAAPSVGGALAERVLRHTYPAPRSCP